MKKIINEVRLQRKQKGWDSELRSKGRMDIFIKIEREERMDEDTEILSEKLREFTSKSFCSGTNESTVEQWTNRFQAEWEAREPGQQTRRKKV